MNEKFIKGPDERRSITQLYWITMQLYWINMQLVKYAQKYKQKRWAKKVAAREKHLVSHVQKQFERTKKHGSSIPGEQLRC